MTTKKEIPVTEAIERLRALREKATAGKWLAPDTSEGDVWDMRLDGEPGIPLMRSERGNYRSWGRSLDNHERSANAAAIVAAMNALPALLDCAEALQGLHDDTVEYVTLNKLHDADGSPAINNHWMKQARAALDALAKEVGT